MILLLTLLFWRCGGGGAGHVRCGGKGGAAVAPFLDALLSMLPNNSDRFIWGDNWFIDWGGGLWELWPPIALIAVIRGDEANGVADDASETLELLTTALVETWLLILLFVLKLIVFIAVNADVMRAGGGGGGGLTVGGFGGATVGRPV